MDSRAFLNNIIYKLIHFIAGFLTALTTYYNNMLSILLFIIFIIYELDEDWHLSDQAFKDILEYAVGLYAAAIILLVVELSA